MALGRKRILIIGGVLAILAAIAVGVQFYIGYKLRKTVDEKIASLREKGLSIEYDTLYVHLRNGEIKIENIRIRKTEVDTTCSKGELFSATSLDAKGLSLLALLFRSEANFTTIEFKDPSFRIKEKDKLLSDTAAAQPKDFRLSAKDVVFRNLQMEFLDSGSCKPNSTVHTNLRTKDLELNWHEKEPFNFKFGQVVAEKSTIALISKLYSVSVKKIDVDFSQHKLDIDSVKINPTKNKLAFGRTLGYEADRIEGTIPFVRLRGLTVNHNDTVIVNAKHSSVKMFLRIFRDKRLRFRKVDKPLPVHYLQSLKFGINIDTFQLEKSYIEYEEFAEEGGSSGTVFFDDLTADIYNINNDRRESEGTTRMVAQANLMGEADLRVETEFPWNETKKCLLKGSLHDLSIAKVNSLMQSVTNVKAESGKLEKLKFEFLYNAIRSDGKLELNYSDLKLITYKDDDKVSKRIARKRKQQIREVNKEENKFKSWILNNFIIRKNVDEKDPKDKRTGTIEFYRDPNRSIFNYWWKSLLSGLRSAFNLDRFNERDNRRNRKKQK